MQERVYCKLHVLHAYQPRGARAEEGDNKTKVNEELPNFIEKKIKTA